MLWNGRPSQEPHHVVAGFGILVVSIAIHFITARDRVLHWGVAAALLVAFGLFLSSSIVLESDYLWFVAALFGLAVLTAVCFLWNARQLAAGKSARPLE